MRRRGSGSRSSLVFVLLACSSVTLTAASAHADLSFPIPDPFTGSDPAPPTAATRPPVTPLSPPAPSPPIELREIFWGDRYGQLRHGPFPFQGGKPLEGADLYRALGRDDLARAYESRGEAKVALALAGLGAIVVGAIVLASATPETHCDTPPKYSGTFQPPVCATDWKEGRVAAGVGIVLSGPVVMLVAGLAFDVDPVSFTERKRLIDAFNAALAHPADGASAR